MDFVMDGLATGRILRMLTVVSVGKATTLGLGTLRVEAVPS